jgi:hypothetical protein
MINPDEQIGHGDIDYEQAGQHDYLDVWLAEPVVESGVGVLGNEGFHWIGNRGIV